ncbi:3'-5' RNA exonuclease complex component [Paecilomyces lecythidis]
MSTADNSPRKPLIAGKNVIIVGCGIAGLAFPLALRKQWPEEYIDEFPNVTIYERDCRETHPGREGYSISIRGDNMGSGIQTLHKMGLLERMLQVSITGTSKSESKGKFTLWDLDWQPLLSIAGPTTDGDLPATSMRIRRDALRQVMIDALEALLPEGSIHWETTCTKVEPQPSKVKVTVGRNNAVDSSDVEKECDILIVADGAGSKIRTQLRPEDRLSFRGIVCLAGVARFPEGEVPKPMDRNWGGVLGAGPLGLFVSPVDARSALWNLSYRADQPRQRLSAPLSDDQANELLHEALDRAKPFKEPTQTLIKATDPATMAVYNAMDKQPFSHDANSKVIFIGDSNHAMSPFAGNGANMALMDAWDLALQLSKSMPTSSSSSLDLGPALKAYDEMSIPRSSKAINRSHWSISVLHSAGITFWAYKIFFAIVRLIKA